MSFKKHIASIKAYDYVYSKSLRFGLRDGSLDKKPKINKDEKKITVAYTKIFNVNIGESLENLNL